MPYKLLLARKRLELTQSEVAERIGVKRHTYHRIENGKQMPKADVAARIIHLLQVDSDIFLSDDVRNAH